MYAQLVAWAAKCDINLKELHIFYGRATSQAWILINYIFVVDAQIVLKPSQICFSNTIFFSHLWDEIKARSSFQFTLKRLWGTSLFFFNPKLCFSRGKKILRRPLQHWAQFEQFLSSYIPNYIPKWQARF